MAIILLVIGVAVVFWILGRGKTNYESDQAFLDRWNREHYDRNGKFIP